MSIITDYNVNGVDIGNFFIQKASESSTQIPSGVGLPTNSLYFVCAISGNGQYMIIGTAFIFSANYTPLYVSNNYGNTWNTRGPNSEWIVVACSPSGQYMAAGHDIYIYVSNDYGSTFNIIIDNFPTLPYGTPSILDFNSLSINDYGLMLTSVQYFNPTSAASFLFYNNSLSPGGSSGWVQQNVNGVGQPLYIDACKISNNSSNIYNPQFMCCVTSFFLGFTGGIWIYTDTNPNWTNFGDTNVMYKQICISNSGQYGWVTDSSNNFYKSINYGQTWNLSTSPINVTSNFSVSGDGSTIFMNNGTSNNYVSYNYGNNWKQLPGTQYGPNSVSLSNNGLICLLAGVSTNTNATGVYLYSLTPSNNLTGYLVNENDLSNIFNPQFTDPGINYIITNYTVINYTPLWSITGNYDLGQIFQNNPSILNI